MTQSSRDDAAQMKQALLAIRELRERLAAAERQTKEPIAIVGMGCRFPGAASSPEAFWSMLERGGDVVGPPPPARTAFWSASNRGTAGEGVVVTGSYLSEALDGFDADYFQIAPNEVKSMDPQQRMLLEVSSEALEHAGIGVRSLFGANVGVFVGLNNSDYSEYQYMSGNRELVDPYSYTGNQYSVAAGRISYTFGFEGPNVAIDTACSSSLVALHLAAQSLRVGECGLALAGGVSLILSDAATTGLARIGALSPDGRCWTFDARANGFARGEGCAIVVLKRLKDALADKDRVLGVLRGSAINHDGRSSGLTAPNGASQEVLLRRALESAAVPAASIGYVEAHGTGTKLGDPIEVGAIGAILSKGRAKDRPLYLGSVKTNIGHLEAAAGVAGVVKVVQALRHGKIPPHPQFQSPNPMLELTAIPAEVPTKLTDWPVYGEARLAGVSAFGISGTNAHVVLSEPPADDTDFSKSDALAASTEPLVLTVSAKSAAGLQAYAKKYVDYLSEATEESRRDIAYTAACRREHHEHRLSVVGKTRAEWMEKLRAFAYEGAGVTRSTRDVVFIFPGQGSQWLGMGRELLAREPVFRESLERIDRVLKAHADWSVLEQLAADEATSRMGEVNVAQPLIFALQVALAEQWKSWGVNPTAVVGHSMGEVAAAFISGRLSLEDAVRVITVRSRLAARIQGKGGMAVVEMTMAQAEEALAKYNGALSIAASNGPRSTVVSGDVTALDAFVEETTAREIFCRKVKVTFASHSSQIDSLETDLLRELSPVKSNPGEVRFASTVDLEGEQVLDAKYWWRNFREPVRFSQRVAGLAQAGQRIFLEISPHPLLTESVRECLRELKSDGMATGSLRRNEDELASLLDSLGALHCGGYEVDWAKRYAIRGRIVSLPSYPWQRERYWVEVSKEKRVRSGSWPFIDVHVETSSRPGEHTVQVMLDVSSTDLTYLSDHKVIGEVWFPGTGYIELALEAAQEVFGPRFAGLEDIQFEQSLVLTGGEPVELHLEISPEEDGVSRYQIASRAKGSAAWTVHGRGKIRLDKHMGDVKSLDVAALQRRCESEVDAAEFYEQHAERGLEYGTSFQGIEAAYRGEAEVLGRLVPPSKLVPGGGAYALHPSVLDACFQLVAAAVSGAHEGDGTFVPTSVEQVRWFAKSTEAAWGYVKMRGADSLESDVTLVDARGKVLAEVRGLRCEALGKATARNRLASLLYDITWRELERGAAATATSGTWVLLTDASGKGASLSQAMAAKGQKVVEVKRGARREDVERALASAAEGGIEGIVHLWSLDAKPSETDAAQNLLSVVHIIQWLSKAALSKSPRLFLVTAGAQRVEGSAVSAQQGTLWGMGASLVHEHAEVHPTLVDIEPETPAEALHAELMGADDQDRVALRGGKRYGAVLVRREMARREELVSHRELEVGAEGYALDVRVAGELDTLHFVPQPRPTAGPGEVVIRVAASGLNFRDVMIGMGVRIGEGRLPMGTDCAGVIVAVGEGVQDFAEGDEVVGFAPFSFDAYIACPARGLVRKPATMSMPEGSSIPTVFMTVHHALHHVGRLKKGEWVLIHSAAGGIGLAAIQYARQVGAQIIATVGTEEKRALLHSMGIEHVFDSRSLSWVQDVKRVTEGRGVNVVLNSLAGEALVKGLESLAPFGRFLELGKRDIYANANVGMYALRNNVTMSAIALEQMLADRPDERKALLEEVMEWFAAGRYTVLPLTKFPISRVAEAFRLMTRGVHVGKIVLEAEERVTVEERGLKSVVRGDRTYWITGGLGGLGLVCAERLVAMGVRHLVLSGRSAPSESAREIIRRLEEQGATVRTEQADIAVRKDVDRVLASLDASMAPLGGVIHAAGILEDGAAVNLTETQIENVLRPKVAGGWHLHEATKGRSLDHFVLFSSVAAVLGSAGQTNYASGNSFLDSLAAHRQSIGLAGQSINWGAWSEVGLAVGRSHVDRFGLPTISPAEGADLFEYVMGTGAAQVVAMRMSFRQWQQVNPKASGIPFLREVMQQKSQTREAQSSVAKKLTGAAAEDRRGILEEFLKSVVSRLSGIAPEKLQHDREFKQLGFDSLMMIGLKNTLERELGVALSTTSLYAHPTVRDLAAWLDERMFKSGAPVEAAPAGAEAAAVTAAAAAPSAVSHEPIAIVGHGYRYPTAGNGGFWELLRAGKEARGEVPRDRWDGDGMYDPDPAASGKSRTKYASFVDSHDGVVWFEPEFFGISPYEAEAMDPQQRLLLEVTQEALSNSGIPAKSLRGKRTGVFIGAAAWDYDQRLVRSNRPELEPFIATGNFSSILSSRLSYVFDWMGPSVTVDTACSSSLVALDQACESLRRHASEVALVGGVNVLSSPYSFVVLSKLQALSPDGRCKTFDASADGYGRGEGCGVMVLKRLSDALASGDRIHGLILATAVGQDGRTSGITAPNPDAQEQLLRQALHAAEVKPEDIQYIEAHGTGTVLGDPIEIEALGRVFGQRSGYLSIGSVKSNIGHLETAAGIAGLSKLLLSLEHRRLPASLHFKNPNPHIPWDVLPIRVQKELGPWPEPSKRLLAGVSSFGFGGTIAHAILSEAPEEEPGKWGEADALAERGAAEVLLVSAKTEETLAAYAKKYVAYLSGEGEGTYRDEAYTSSCRSEHYEYRLAVVGKSRTEWLEKLRSYGDAVVPEGLRSSRARDRRGGRGPVFVFSGQGSQWVGMGRELYAERGVFAAELTRCSDAVKAYAGFSVIDELLKDEGSRLNETEIAQVALWALQMSLVAQWRAWGIEPSAVVGHSIGEIAACQVAGVLNLEQAARLVVERGRLMQRATGQGKMALVGLTEKEAEEAIADYRGRLSIGAANGPKSTVLSGEAAALEEVLSRLQQRKVFTRALPVNYAFHSDVMTDIARELETKLGFLKPGAPRLKLVSTLTGEEGATYDGGYWARQVRERVKFHPSIRRLVDDGHDLFLEIGPHPVLSVDLGETVGASGTVLPSLRRSKPELAALKDSLGALYCAGYDVDWSKHFAVRGRVVSLPTYPWQRERYWVEVDREKSARSSKWPLIDGFVETSSRPGEFTVHVSLDIAASDHAYLAGHKVAGEVWFPGAAFIEVALQAAQAVFGARFAGLSDIQFGDQSLVLSEGEPVDLHLEISPEENGVSSYQITSRPKGYSAWTVHGGGKIRLDAHLGDVKSLDLAAIQRRCESEIDASEFYDQYAERGLEYGPTFRGIEMAYRGTGEALGRLITPVKLVPGATAYALHPSVLDACFQLIAAAVPRVDWTFVAAGVEQVRWFGKSSDVVWGHVKMRAGESLHADVTLVDAQGKVLAEVRGLRAEALGKATTRNQLSPLLYDIAWREVERATAAVGSGTWVVLTDGSGRGESLSRTMASNGHKVVEIKRGTSAAEQERLLSAAGAAGLEGIAHLWSLDTAPTGETLSSVVQLIQWLAKASLPKPPRLYLVTSGAQRVDGSPVSAHQGMLWGMGTSLVHEHGELRPTLVDIDAETPAEALYAELVGADEQDRIALRGGKRYGAVLVRRALARHKEEGEGAREVVRGDRTYWITGGLGGLGLVCAERLVSMGVRHLVLSGRSAPTDVARHVIQRLEQQGAKVRVEQADIGARADVDRVLSSIDSTMAPLGGIIHAAGVIDDAAALNLGEPQIEKVLRPKVDGGWHLHEATKERALDHFVVFSSMASILGSAGQANYAAANSFLDSLAAYRQSAGLPGLSINWGAWSEVGMAVGRGHVDRYGLPTISPAEGADLFEYALGTGAAQVVAMRMSFRQWQQVNPKAAGMPFLREVMLQKSPQREGQSAVAKKLKSAAAEDRRGILQEYLKVVAARLSGTPYDKVLQELEFKQLGFDSLMMIGLKNTLERELGVALSTTALYAHPTVRELGVWLEERMFKSSEPLEATSKVKAAAPATASAPTANGQLEAIAVVGHGYRYPAAEQGGFWDLLSGGKEARGEVPKDRWDWEGMYDPDPGASGKSSTKYASFVDSREGVVWFDPDFFGISPYEAEAMDPQQRLLLEVTQEALSNSGIPAKSLRGKRTGVFIGAGAWDNGSVVMRSNRPELEPFVATGNSSSIMSNRLSYVFDWMGPSVTVDTACSSSLVALDQACESLRRHASEVAVVGGVNVLSSPYGFVTMSKLQALSPDGRCKSFDASGDGYGRGEGCGVLILKRLSDALASGDRIHGLILGTAVGQDGRTSGITAPNPDAQEQLLRQALDVAQVSAEDIQYIEAHGTGTVLGDPIEVEALGRVFGQRSGYLSIGSVKSNIGHLETAAGVAGVSKLLLSMGHRRLPPSLHFKTPNPHIPWDALPIRVQKELGPWPEPSKRLLAGVSSFGFGGTIAHVILSEAPEEEPGTWGEADALAERGGAEVLLISAKSAEGLEAYAKKYVAYLSGEGEGTYRDEAYTSSCRSEHYEHRLAVVGKSRTEWLEKLRAFGESVVPEGLRSGRARDMQGARGPVFVFAGQGSQWVGMGRELYAERGAFAAELTRCSDAVKAYAGFSVIDELLKDEGSRLNETEIAQVALWALQMSLVAQWRAWGIEPSAVVGHSIGEIAACQVAGVLNLEQAARLVVERGRLMQRATGQGKMALVGMMEKDAERAIADYRGRLSVGAVNGRRSTVLSGEAAALEMVLFRVQAQGIYTRELPVNYAFHSDVMTDIARELETKLDFLKPGAPRLKLVSTLTGEEGATYDASYWARQVRERVKFYPSIRRLVDEGHDLFLEIGPHPVLSVDLGETVGTSGTVLPSLRRSKSELGSLKDSMAALHCAGYDVDWSKQFAVRGRVVSLPTYPWQRERYWVEAAKETVVRTGKRPFVADHFETSSRPGEHTVQTELDLSSKDLAYLSGHKVGGAVWFPGAGFIELALEAAQEVYGDRVFGLEDIRFEQALVLSEGEPVTVHVELSPEVNGRSHYQIASRAKGKTLWTVHGRGDIRLDKPADESSSFDVAAVQKRSESEMSGSDFYEQHAERGLEYSGTFQGIDVAYRGDGEALGKLVPPVDSGSASSSYTLHPAVLDSCFQLMGLSIWSGPRGDATFVPTGVESVRWFGKSNPPAWGHVKVRGGEVLEADVTLVDAQGDVVAEVRGLRAEALGKSTASDQLSSLLYDIAWREAARGATAAEGAGTWVLLTDGSGKGESLSRTMISKGHKVLEIKRGTSAAEQERLLAAAGAGGLSGVVHLWSLDAQPTERGAVQTVLSVIEMVQWLSKASLSKPPRLYLVTQGAQSVEGSPVSAQQGMLWGMGTSLMHEHGELRPTLVDVAADTPPDVLYTEIVGADEHDRIALRGGKRYGAVLVRGEVSRRQEVVSHRELHVGAEGYILEVGEPGQLDTLHLAPRPRPTPGRGEVVIRVVASGLNFRDVLMGMGMYPGAGEGRLPMGGECAGVIVSVGEGVQGLVEGDEVVAIPSAFAFDSYVVCRADGVVRKPSKMSMADGSSIPTVFMTVHYALHHAGRLRKGEWILIHSAAGGIGLAAIQYAQQVGARIIATVGTEEKRTLLHSMGIEHVFDSRSSSWFEDVKRVTSGRGVDVVLNSLAGEAIPKGLESLAPFGRFLELGKRDIYQNASVGMYALRNNVTISAIALEQMLAERPDERKALLEEVMGWFEAGRYKVLPCTTFPISKASEAFRLMTRGVHVGKLVLEAEANVTVEERGLQSVVRGDRTYWITGGLGGLGLVCAERLAAMGVRHLLLTGRSAPSESAREAIGRLEAQGVEVRTEQADIGARADVDRVLAAIDASMAPLGGVIHAAGVLQDGTAVNMSEAQIEKVLRPKVDGSWHLHEATKERALDHFVLFSSVAAVLGSAGQTNYASANSFLDSLAAYRRSSGLAGQSINWGAWSEVGMAVGRGHVDRSGLPTLSPAEGAELFEYALGQSSSRVVAMRMSFRLWQQMNPNSSKSPFLRDVTQQKAAVQGQSSIAKKLKSAVAEERRGILEEYLRMVVSRLSGISQEKLDQEREFKQLGFDSLMMIGLKNTLERELNVRVSLSDVYGHPTVNKLVRLIGGQM